MMTTLKIQPQDNVIRYTYIIILLAILHFAFAQDDERAYIKNDTYSITADSVELDSKNKIIKADGKVMIKDIDNYFAADSLFMKYEKSFNGELQFAIKRFLI
ncbi:MAG: hypothetical protein WCO98_08220, partial [bacterium]